MEPTARAIVTERRAFAETLEAVGPDAPTLAGSWTAADIAAHVLSLDRLGGVPTFLGRTVVSRWAIRLNDAAGRFADASIKAIRRRGFAWSIERLRLAPPGLLLRPSVAAVGLFEVFVHHEDVRRASGPSARRAAPDGLIAAVPWLLRYHRKLLPEVALVVRGAETEFSTGTGTRVVLEGDPAEVVLWLAGRSQVADVRLSGDEDAVRRLHHAAIHI
jgi:uncharacterized protein (TIGR03085 family)